MTASNPSRPEVAPSRPSALRIGLTGVAAAALVAVGILAVAMSAAPSRTLASDANTGGTTSTSLADGRAGFGGRGPGFGVIAITAINGSNISLKTADGWTRTVTVDSGTTYARSGATISLSDLRVGDEIRLRQTLESDGTYSIDSIDVIPPHLAGTVTAISGSTITLRLADGSTGTVKVGASTTYQVGTDTSASLGDVKVGMVLVAEGTKAADGSLTASAIRAGNLGAFMGLGHDGMGRGWHGGDAAPDAS